MRGARIIVVVGAALAAGLCIRTAPATAQPAGGSDEIDMEEGSGSGSAKPAKPAPPPPAEPPAETPKDPKVSKAALAAGKDLAAKGDALAKKAKTDEANAQYELALVQLQTAVLAGDDVNLNFPLAVVEDKLGRYDVAIKHYRLITTAKTGAQPAIVKQAQAKIDDALTKVGQVTLVVVPEGATISMNGNELGVTPLPAIVLMPGTYTLSIVADGFQGKDVELKVEAGSESERKIELEKMKVIIEGTDKSRLEETPDDKPLPPSKLPLYIGAGATGFLFGVGVIEGILAVHQHSTFVAAGSTPSQRDDAKLNGRFYAHVADACFVGTLLGAAFTTYWYLVRYKHPPAQAKFQQREVPKVDMIPWVQPDAGGFAVAGWF